MYKWQSVDKKEPKQYKCDHCGNIVGSNLGYESYDTNTAKKKIVGIIYICSVCGKPTYFDEYEVQIPACKFGSEVENLPDDINRLYNEARACIGVGAYTASVLACRKLLMNVAVNKGASENQSFKQYVEYLDKEGYIAKGWKNWVDHIRDKGNDATHEIPALTQKDAEKLVTFAQMLLQTMFEFPGKIKSDTE